MVPVAGATVHRLQPHDVGWGWVAACQAAVVLTARTTLSNTPKPIRVVVAGSRRLLMTLLSGMAFEALKFFGR